MKPIIIELHREQNFVYGKVLQMPEEIRGCGVIIQEDDSEEKICYDIISEDSPELVPYSLCLWGRTRVYDNCWFSFEYSTVEKAIQAVEKYKKLIEIWNQQHTGVLDEREKEYLSAVIKPFKDKVKWIRKNGFRADGKECIVIEIIDCYSTLPIFEKGTMYKGMKVDRDYTLKDLGLE